MKKLLLTLAGLALILASCAKKDDISNLQSQIDELKSDKIASIESQITSINTSIKSLGDMDKELKDYIETLQTTAGNLQKAIEENDKKIDDVKAELNTNISTAKSELLSSLESLRGDMKGELATINTTILSLQQKDVEIDGKIVDLKSYVNDELKKTQDWATGTFATLKQFNDLSGEVSAIKADIVLVKESITSLETRLTDKINKDISGATALLDAQIKQSVKDVTDAYTKAVSDAKTEITEAYEKAIANAVNALETSMKSWVNEQLTGYYTISETETRLTAVQTNLESQLASQKTYLEGLITGLQTTLTSKIDANKTLIDGLQSQVNQLSADLSTLTGKVATNSTNISNNAKAISDNAKAISQNAADIDACEKLIAANKKLIDENTAAINANDKDIAALQSRATADEKKIADNAAGIAKNAADVAKNAELIAANATAISNNAKAISDNAAEIVQLKADLAQAKKDITDAYTKAIADAISASEGKLTGQIAEEVETINKRITDEIAAVKASIEAIEARVKSCEDSIASIVDELAGIKENLGKVLARIQSMTVLPTYNDGSVAIKDNENTEIAFEILPREASVALAKQNISVFSLDAIVTGTKASRFTNIPIVSVRDDGECLVVTVDGSGLDAGFFAGTQTLGARLKVDDGNNSKATEYFALYPHICPKSITLNYSSKELSIGDSFQLKASFCPSNVTNKNIRWSTDDTAIATVDNTGLVTSQGVGVVTIRAISEETPSVYSSCSVFVVDAGSNIIYYTSIDGKVFTPTNTGGFGATLLSNTYIDGIGILKFDGPVTKIGGGTAYGGRDAAFANCNKLSSITLPPSITRIETGAFYYCTELRSINIPKNVTYFGDWAFDGCYNLERVDIEDLTKWCTNVSFGTYWPNPLSYGCIYINNHKTTSLEIPDDVMSISSSAFYHNYHLESVYIPGSVHSVNGFSGCSHISSLTLSDGIKVIGNSAFSGNESLVEVIIPDSVESIGSYAFSNSTATSKLKKIILGNGIKSIGKDAFSFYSTDNLEIICNSPTPPTLSGLIANTDNTIIYVPDSSIQVYQESSYWSDYTILSISSMQASGDTRP